MVLCRLLGQAEQVYQQDLVGEGDAELAIPPSEISSREQTPPEELRSDDENKYEADEQRALEAGADTA